MIWIGLMSTAMNLFGQGIYHHPEAWFAPAPSADSYLTDSTRINTANRSSLPGIRYGLNVGTSFSSGGYYGNMYQSWVAPEIQFPVSERFFVRMGVMAGYINATNMVTGPAYSETPGSTAGWMTYGLFAEGSYRLSDDVTLTGSVFKKIDRTPE